MGEIKLSTQTEFNGPRCPICSESFFSRKSLRTHRNVVHRADILARKVTKRQRRAKKNKGELDGKQHSPEPVSTL